ncbi:chromo domain-containing protein, partial [Colletotrichum incanum]
MRITYLLPDPNTACRLDVLTTAANAPVAEMNCLKEPDSSTPEPEATTSLKRPRRVLKKAMADLQTDYFLIKELIRHRRYPTCDTLFEINEPESNLQKDAVLTLFAYWRRVKGGRESAIVDRELWHVFKVVSHETKPDGSVYLQ